MLYGKCIFSQSKTPDFQRLEGGSMDPPMLPPSIVLASVFKGSDSQRAKKFLAEHSMFIRFNNMLVSHN